MDEKKTKKRKTNPNKKLRQKRPTVRDTAQAMGVNEEVLRRAARADGIKAGDDPAAAAAVYARMNSGREQYRDAMTRKAIADASMREHKLAVARREVVSVEIVRRAIVRMIHAAKSKVLSGVKTGFQIGASRSGINPATATAIEQEIETRVRDAMIELSKGEYASVKCECGKEW